MWRMMTGIFSPCARPGPQVPGTMPVSIARRARIEHRLTSWDKTLPGEFARNELVDIDWIDFERQSLERQSSVREAPQSMRALKQLLLRTSFKKRVKRAVFAGKPKVSRSLCPSLHGLPPSPTTARPIYPTKMANKGESQPPNESPPFLLPDEEWFEPAPVVAKSRQEAMNCQLIDLVCGPPNTTTIPSLTLRSPIALRAL